MSRLAKYPSERALAVIDGPLALELDLHRCNAANRSKLQLFEIGGVGGRQFGLVVGDMYSTKNPKSPKQTRIVLEKCDLPALPGISPCLNDYSGSRATQGDSRLTPLNQASCLVADEMALVQLLRWYAGGGSITKVGSAGISAGALTQTRIEKAAQDAGFDLSASVEGEWSVFHSTAFPQALGVTSLPDGGYRLGLPDAVVGRQIGAEFGIEVDEAAERWAILLTPVRDYQTLHEVILRVAEMCRVVAGAALKEFEQATRKRPDTTEAVRLVVQRVGQDIFRKSLLDYWGRRCSVSGLAVPQLLRASHIKPWADCDSDAERLDVFNGLLLAPHLDALFDGGWVTFTDAGEMLVAEKLDAASRDRLNLSGTERISGLTDRHCAYLAWHRERRFGRMS